MKILLISNFARGLYNFKKELIQELLHPNSYLNNNYLSKNEVFICVPHSEIDAKFEELGCFVINVDMERRGTNPFKDFVLLKNYHNIIKKVKPDVAMTFTIKPNIYAGIAAQLTQTEYISNVTGLGSSIRSDSKLKGFISRLYKIGVKGAKYINFENQSDLDFFNDYIYINNKSKLMAGSGVNFDRFKFQEYPSGKKNIKFLTIGRIMRDKGSFELLEAAKVIKENYPNVEFNLVGSYEEGYFKDIIKDYAGKGIINYLGVRNDVPDLIKDCHCVIHPSYHEGLSNVLLEAAASGRPVIASDVPGCRETYINNVTGLSISPKNIESIVEAIEDFIEKDYESKKLMGIKARKYIEDRFDRKDVVAKHIEQINNITFND
ncbi:glycosyltransferase family 4 protein [Anaerococcus jeddahensis]|uniref:glycosyltransferase family 4 protein n=1 Tax=Anaerococcus jeddahensis TaxID=1673719 RepID=UPI0006723637|nr:glycosyltransferase family 4 protein [Anaerococcus jeddahensis]